MMFSPEMKTDLSVKNLWKVRIVTYNGSTGVEVFFYVDQTSDLSELPRQMATTPSLFSNKQSKGYYGQGVS